LARRYRNELEESERVEALTHLRELAKRRALTPPTVSNQADISEAVVLLDLIRG